MSRTQGPIEILPPPPLTPAQIAAVLRPDNQKTLYDSIRRGSFDHVQQLRDATQGSAEPGVLKVVLEALRNCRVPERSEMLRRLPAAVKRARFSVCALSAMEDQCRNSESGPRSVLLRMGALVHEFWDALVGWYTFFFHTGTHLFRFLEIGPVAVMKSPVLTLMSLMKAFEETPYDLRNAPGALEVFILVWNCREFDGTPIIIAKDGFADGLCPISTIISRFTGDAVHRERLLLKMITEGLLPLDELVFTITARVVKIKELYLARDIDAGWLVAFICRNTNIALDFADNSMVKNALLESGFLRIFVDALWTVAKNSHRKELGLKGWQALAEVVTTLFNWTLVNTVAILPRMIDLLEGNILQTALYILSNIPKENPDFRKTIAVLGLLAVNSSHPPLLSALHAPMELLVSSEMLVRKATSASPMAANAVSALTEAYRTNSECARGRWKQAGKRRLCDNVQHSFWYEEETRMKGVEKTCSGCRSVTYCSSQCQREDWTAFHRRECKGAAQENSLRKSDRVWIRHAHRSYYYSLIEHLATKSNALIAGFRNTRYAGVIPLFDLSVNPYDIKTIPTTDFRARASRYKFREQRLTAFLDQHEERGSTFLIAAVFYYGPDKVHILARMAETPELSQGSSKKVNPVPFQVVGSLIHYERIPGSEGEGLYESFAWSLNQNVKAMSSSQANAAGDSNASVARASAMRR